MTTPRKPRTGSRRRRKSKAKRKRRRSRSRNKPNKALLEEAKKLLVPASAQACVVYLIRIGDGRVKLGYSYRKGRLGSLLNYHRGRTQTKTQAYLLGYMHAHAYLTRKLRDIFEARYLGHMTFEDGEVFDQLARWMNALDEHAQPFLRAKEPMAGAEPTFEDFVWAEACGVRVSDVASAYRELAKRRGILADGLSVATMDTFGLLGFEEIEKEREQDRVLFMAAQQLPAQRRGGIGFREGLAHDIRKLIGEEGAMTTDEVVEALGKKEKRGRVAQVLLDLSHQGRLERIESGLYGPTPSTLVFERFRRARVRRKTGRPRNQEGTRTAEISMLFRERGLLSLDEVAEALGEEDEAKIGVIKSTVARMAKEGRIRRIKRGLYAVAEHVRRFDVEYLAKDKGTLVEKIEDLLSDKRRKNPLTSSEIAKRLDAKPVSVSATLSRMVKEGKARRVGRGAYLGAQVVGSGSGVG